MLKISLNASIFYLESQSAIRREGMLHKLEVTQLICWMIPLFLPTCIHTVPVLAANKHFSCELGQNDSTMVRRVIQVYQIERCRHLLVYLSCYSIN